MDPLTAHPRTSVTPVVIALIVVSLAWKVWASAGSWFYGDDFVFLADVAGGENDLAWYFHRHDVQVMPLSFVLVSLAGSAGAFAWWAAAVQIVVLGTLASVACWWMLRRVFGPAPILLLPLAFYLFSPLIAPAYVWWAVALNVVAVQTPIFIMIGAHVEYVRTHRRRWLVVAGVAFAVALGFFLKALLAPVVLAMFTTAYAAAGRGAVQAVIAAVRRFWPLWATYGLLTVGYLVWYASFGQTGTIAPNRDADATFLAMFVDNLATGLLGGPWRWADLGAHPRTLADPPQLAVLAAVVAAGMSVAFLIRRRTGAWRVLVVLAPALVASFALIAFARAGNFGPTAALEPRYWADCLPYFTLALALLARPVRGLGVRRHEVPKAARPLPSSALIGIGVVYVVSSLYSATTYVLPWHTDFRARAYVTTAAEHLTTTGPALADVPVPDDVVLATLFPTNTPSHLFAALGDAFTTPPAGVDLQVLDAWGVPRPGRATSDMEVDADELGCDLGTRAIALPATTLDYPFWVTVDSRSSDAMEIVVEAGRNRHTIALPAGRRGVTFTTTGAYDHVVIRTPADAELCIDRLTIGSGFEPR